MPPRLNAKHRTSWFWSPDDPSVHVRPPFTETRIPWLKRPAYKVAGVCRVSKPTVQTRTPPSSEALHVMPPSGLR
jgi:hypothetical protein